MRLPFLSPKSLVLSPLLLLLVGCTSVGALAYKFTPPQKTPAKYELPKETTAVIVENYRMPASGEIDAQQLSQLVATEFRTHDIAPLVDDNAVNDLRDRDPKAYRTMAIPAVGRAVGAKQVVYVDILRLTIDTEAGEQMLKGLIELRVKVVDSVAGDTRWPADLEQGWPVSLETPWLRIDEKMNEQALRRQMHEIVSLQIGRLFRSWVDELESSQPK